LLNLNPKDTLASRDHVTGRKPNAFHALIVDERSVRAPKVSHLTLRRIDLNDEMIARESHVFRHGAMDETRSPNDEGVVPVENE